jgi:ornithine--oxo-acid transaminase
MLQELRRPVGRGVAEVRGRGLWAGIDLDATMPSARALCEQLVRRGVLAKETHGRTLRLAPPLVVDPGDLDWALEQVAAVVGDAYASTNAAVPTV